MMLLGDARQVHLSRWAEYFLDIGYDVATFSLEKVTRFPGQYHHIDISTFWPDALRYPLAVPQLRWHLRDLKPHIVNAHFVPNYGTIARMLGHHPWVMSTWGSDIMTDPDKSRFHRRRTLRALHDADYVTSDARIMSERVVSFGIPDDRVITFPYGVDVNHFRPAPHPAADGPRIVTNRKLEPVYSVQTVLDAFAGVHAELPDAMLTVAGDGRMRQLLLNLAGRSLATSRIVFVGDVQHDRMPMLLRENQIYVSMSLSDTTSVSLLEAMATGLFPIVSDIPANREWITHRENGLLVPVEQPLQLAHSIIGAWRDKPLLQRAREQNLSIIHERAQWQDNMSIVRELFDSILR